MNKRNNGSFSVNEDAAMDMLKIFLQNSNEHNMMTKEGKSLLTKRFGFVPTERRGFVYQEFMGLLYDRGIKVDQQQFAY